MSDPHRVRLAEKRRSIEEVDIHDTRKRRAKPSIKVGGLASYGEKVRHALVVAL